MPRSQRFTKRRANRRRNKFQTGYHRQSTLAEQLETRLMLSAGSLATTESIIPAADEMSQTMLSVTGNTQPVVLTFQTAASIGSELNPAAPEIHDASGNIVLPLFSTDNALDGLDGLSIAELATGDYILSMTGENDTTGSLLLHVGLTGDSDASGQVSQTESHTATAAMVQHLFGFNNVATQVFNGLGINTTTNLYNPSLDANMSGTIDVFDVELTKGNQDAGNLLVEFSDIVTLPSIQASLSNDTGSSNSDGITNDPSVTISGSVSDDTEIASLTASIDNSTPVELATLLGQNLSQGGDFQLNMDQLESIANTGAGSLIDSGEHDLQFIATDDQGGESTLNVTLQIDTISPTAPIDLNLDSASDSGSSNTDKVTNLTSLVFHADAENGAVVDLFSSEVTGAVGTGTVNSPVAITTVSLPEGTHSITATATDVAGNTSAASAEVVVQIDTTPPADPAFDLDPSSDTGTVGDQFTSSALATLVGTSDADVAIQLERAGNVLDATTADASGNFTFSDVSLPFADSVFQTTATDIADNASTFTLAITQNQAPSLNDQTFDVGEASANGTLIGTITADDANLGDGDTLSFDITGGNSDGAFAVDGSTGEITVADATHLDFETTPVFNLTVQVIDSGGDGSGVPGSGFSDSATITIQVLDENEAPAINDHTFTVAENSVSSTPVGTVTASDPDGDTLLEFAITAGNDGSAFEIHPGSGEITTANHFVLDFETTETFVLEVTVTDGGNLSDSGNVTVNLTDINEPVSVADQIFTVSLADPPGSIVDTVEVVDPDANDSFLFEITASDAPAGTFAIDPNSGTLSVSDPTGLHASPLYLLTVRVTDLAGAGFSDEAGITIQVTTNTAPVAMDDLDQTDEDTPSAIDVLADNGLGADTDNDGDDSLLFVSSFDGTSTLGATITEEADGTLLYDPTNAGAIQAMAADSTALVDTYNYVISDPHGGTDSGTVTITLTGVNDAPSLDNTGDPTLTGITEDDLNNNGDAVSDLIGGSMTDVDSGAVQGIAVIVPAVNGIPHVSDGGTWQYSIDAAQTWQDLGSVSLSNALLLRPDDLLRFVPNGTSGATATVSYRGWDQTTGVAGTKVDTGFIAGGTSAFSSAIDRAEITVTDVNDEPTFDVIESLDPVNQVVVRDGTSTHLALDGEDIDEGATLTYSVSVTGGDASIVTPSIASGNRSMRVTVAPNTEIPGGEMVFQLFEQRAGRITDQIINLTEQGAYNNDEYHRVVPNFVIQGGNLSGSAFTVPVFDDQFHTQLLHLGPGYLSMANLGDTTLQNGDLISGDDTNSGGYFITLVDTRFLDGNHSVFGFQVEGQAVRDEIGNVAVNGQSPVNDIFQETVEIFVDSINGVLVISAPEGASGTAQLTVTADDGNGGTSQQIIDVTVDDDVANMTPFLDDIAPVSTTTGTDAVFSVTATDAEGDDYVIDVQSREVINFDDGPNERGITPAGTTDFSHQGSTWSGGEVVQGISTVMGSFDNGIYLVNNGIAEVVFDNPVNAVSFYFVHGLGVAAGTATAFDDNGSTLGSVDSGLATTFADPGNFKTLDFANPIKRITFSNGIVDSFDFRPYDFQVTTDSQGNATVTVTPAAGVTGQLQILVRVKPVVPANVTTASTIDTQVVTISVDPALHAEWSPTTVAAPITISDTSDDSIQEILNAAIDTWQATGLLSDRLVIDLEVRDFNSQALGSTAILETDGHGNATTALVSIDDDASGCGWYIGMEAPSAQAGFDLYSVLLHEIGHAVGFSDALSGFEENRSQLTAAGVDVVMTLDGHHLDSDIHVDDLMNPVLSPGERRNISDLDLLLLGTFATNPHHQVFADQEVSGWLAK